MKISYVIHIADFNKKKIYNLRQILFESGLISKEIFESKTINYTKISLYDGCNVDVDLNMYIYYIASIVIYENELHIVSNNLLNDFMITVDCPVYEFASFLQFNRIDKIKKIKKALLDKDRYSK